MQKKIGYRFGLEGFFSSFMPGCRSLAMGRLLLVFTVTVDWEPHLPLVQLCWVLVRESRKVAGVLKHAEIY
jgi:hypothetical protein